MLRLRPQRHDLVAAGVPQSVEHRPERLVRLAISALSGDGNTLAIGASLEDSAATGINGKQDDDSADGGGRRLPLHADRRHLAQQAYMKSSNTEAFDEFGNSAALSRDGRTLVVGGRGEDGGGAGVNGNQADNSVDESGAAFVFGINSSPTIPRRGGSSDPPSALEPIRRVVGGDGHLARWTERHTDEAAARDEQFGLAVEILQTIQARCDRQARRQREARRCRARTRALADGRTSRGQSARCRRDPMR